MFLTGVLLLLQIDREGFSILHSIAFNQLSPNFEKRTIESGKHVDLLFASAPSNGFFDVDTAADSALQLVLVLTRQMSFAHAKKLSSWQFRLKSRHST